MASAIFIKCQYDMNYFKICNVILIFFYRVNIKFLFRPVWKCGSLVRCLVCVIMYTNGNKI